MPAFSLLKGIELKLEPEERIAGKLVDELGHPAGGAHLLLLDDAGCPCSTYWETTADETGAFLIRSILPGIYHVVARREKRTGESAPVDVEAETTSETTVEFLQPRRQDFGERKEQPAPFDPCASNFTRACWESEARVLVRGRRRAGERKLPMTRAAGLILIFAGAEACTATSPKADPQSIHAAPSTEKPSIGSVVIGVSAPGVLAERLERVAKEGIRRLGDVRIVEDLESDDVRDWTIVIAATELESTDQFHSRWALAITILDHASILPAFHAAPKDLRNVIEYPLSEAAFYKNSWVQFCSEDPADEDPTSFVKQIDARVFAERREMSSDDRAKIAMSLQEIRKEGWR